MSNKDDPPLYICPYCRKGFSSRLTGWTEALAHIKAKHTRTIRNGGSYTIPPEKRKQDPLFADLAS